MKHGTGLRDNSEKALGLAVTELAWGSGTVSPSWHFYRSSRIHNLDGEKTSRPMEGKSIFLEVSTEGSLEAWGRGGTGDDNGGWRSVVKDLVGCGKGCGMNANRPCESS